MHNPTSQFNSITIFGCGWLGFETGKFLVKKGFSVSGTTTTPEKLPALHQENICGRLFNINDYKENDLTELLKSRHILFNLPPTGIKISLSGFLDNLLAKWKCEADSKFIFISSTSVYGEVDGLVNEHSPVNPQTQNAKMLVEAENTLLSKGKNIWVLRPSGLIGPGRKPGRFLAGKKNVTQPDKVVNLVHRDDIIQIIHKILSVDYSEENRVFNLSMDKHPERKAFYTKAAELQGFEPPEFESPSGKTGKIIDNSALKVFLNYEYLYSDPFTAI